MRVFVTGATGAIGRRAVPALVAAGHQVTGVARSPGKAEQITAAGAVAVSLDVFDPSALRPAVAGHDAVVNLATHLPPASKAWRRAEWRTNDRLRRELSRQLVDAALAAGASLFAQESLAMQYADGGDRWLDESAPIGLTSFLASLADAEAAVARFTAAGGTGLALRFGQFYSADDNFSRYYQAAVRKGIAMPPGPSDGYYPMLHMEDAARAIVATVGGSAVGGSGGGVPAAGVYNVCDDEPLLRVEHAAVLADALGVRRKIRTIPSWVLKLGGEAGRHLLRSQRVGNRRFREATGWAPEYPSVREGWPAALS